MVTPIKGIVPNPTTINGTLLSLPCWRLSFFLVPDTLEARHSSFILLTRPSFVSVELKKLTAAILPLVELDCQFVLLKYKT